MQMLRKYGWAFLLILSQPAFGLAPGLSPPTHESGIATAKAKNPYTNYSSPALLEMEKSPMDVPFTDPSILNPGPPAPSGLTTNTFVSPTSCPTACDGTAALIASGGVPPYLFYWPHLAQYSDTIGNLCAGSYPVVVTDSGGNLDSVWIVITSNSSLTVTIPTVIPDSGGCSGALSAAVSGGTAPYQYAWSNGSSTIFANGLCGTANYCVTVTDDNGCTAVQCAMVFSTGGFSLGSSSSNASCGGTCNGSITAMPSGGSAPYYIYFPSLGINGTNIATGLCPGNYPVVGFDSLGNYDSIIVTDGQTSSVSAIIVTNSPDSGNCSGVLQAAGSGGTAPYSYLWSNGQTTASINGCAYQTYCVVVTDANGCTGSICDTITGGQVYLSQWSTPASCNSVCDGSVNLVASGGFPPYTFSFPGLSLNGATATGLCAGSYTGQVIDNIGNVATVVANVNQPNPIAVSIAASLPSFGACNGSLTGFASLGTAPYQFTWSNGAVGQSVSNLCPGNYCLTVTDANGCTGTNCYTLVTSNNMAVQATGTDPSCAGTCDGSISASVTGIAPPFQLFVSGLGAVSSPVTGLCAGNYYVYAVDTLFDTVGVSVTLTDPAPIGITLISAQPDTGACNGSLSVAVANAALPVTYAWSNAATGSTINNLCAGNYCVTVTDANGCTAVECYTVLTANSLGLTISVATTDANCNFGCDGTAQLTVNGATGPVYYNWWWNVGSGSSASNLCPGTYYVVVSDTFYTDTVQFTINSTGPNPVLSVVQPDNGSCNGELQLTINGGTAPFQISWSNGATGTLNQTGLCNGYYDVIVTDTNGCFDTTTITLPAVTGSISYVLNSQDPSCPSSCNGYASLQILNSAGPVNVNWVGLSTTNNYVTGLCPGVYDVVISDSLTLDSLTFTINQPPSAGPFVNNVQPDNGTCNGSATIALTNSTQAPFSYIWSDGTTGPSINNVCGGIYCVTVTSSYGCVDTLCVTIPGPAGLTVNVFSANTICSNTCDGAATASVSGGTPPYAYLWSNGVTTTTINNLCPGNYSVTVTDANGQTGVGSGSVLAPPPITVNITSTDAACGASNGTLSAIPSGGNGGPYYYSLSNGVNGIGFSFSQSGLPSGGYGLITSDSAGCSTVDSIFIGAVGNLNGTISATADTVCPEDTVTLFAGPLVSCYQWYLNGNVLHGEAFSSLTNLGGGQYSVVLSDSSGCSDSIFYTVQELPGATVSSINGPTQVQAGQQYVYDVVGQNGYTYIYSVSGGQVVSPGNNIAKIEWGNGPTGTITVTAISPDGCVAETTLVVYIGITSVAGIQGSNLNFKAFPNPYQGSTQLTFYLSESALVRLEVLDLLGQQVAVLEEATLAPGQQAFTFSARNTGLSAGFYIARLQVGSTTKIVRLIEN